MESQFKNDKIRQILFYLFFISACSGKSKPKVEQLIRVTSDIQNGDIIYRLGNGLFSDFIKDMSHVEKRFSHVGIIYKAAEQDSAFVIHAEADDYSGIGFVKKEPIDIFLKNVRDWAIYRLTTKEVYQKKISDYAFQYHKMNIPFDTAFDETDSSSFYCSELVKHCVNNALSTELIKAKTVKNDKAFIAIDDTYLIDNITFIQIITKK